jgi:uncharacterized protein YegL
MPELRGHLLPVYVMVDESGSMQPYINDLNAGLTSLHGALQREPMAAAKVRFTVLGFSETVIPRLLLADLRKIDQLPPVATRHRTFYGVAFDDLYARIPADVARLKHDGYAVHRPAVFFLSDGQPTDEPVWKNLHRRLVDKVQNPAAPNIIACGIGDATPETILEVATEQRFAFISIAGANIGDAIAKFCTALTKSLVVSGRSLGSAQPELYVDRPEGFHMAIDVI